MGVINVNVICFLFQMQQQELAQMRQRDANLTALAAIGPRKKRKLDSPGGATTGPEVKPPVQFSGVKAEVETLQWCYIFQFSVFSFMFDIEAVVFLWLLFLST